MGSISRLLFFFAIAPAFMGCSDATSSIDKSGSADSVTSIPEALTKTLQWSGYTWNIRSGYGMAGPNNWGATSASVYVDNTNSLNLAVKKIGGKWYSSEVFLQKSLGYGTYEFFLKNRSDIIDSNLIEGLFLYQDDTHELDIEWSKWGVPNGANNGDFAAQGVNADNLNWQQSIAPGNWHKARIIWSPGSVRYQVETNSAIVKDWTITDVNAFIPGGETVHINNWQLLGRAPLNGLASIMTLVSFTFTPL